MSLLFTNMQFPRLKTLSLTSLCTTSWNDKSYGITELYSVLKSSPTVTTLILSDNFLDFTSTQHHYTPWTVRTSSDVPLPIWIYIPYLSHIKLELPDTRLCTETEEAEKISAYIYRAIFRPSFLGLQDPACRIKAITFIIFKQDKSQEQPKWRISETEVAGDVKRIVLDTVQMFLTDAPYLKNVKLYVTEESPKGRSLVLPLEWASGF
ncbi:hypothetical protein BDN70DRAFT_998496 [Pholiota conissans]|uniref:Uncharacterized protein n=1 Tax=Pholiota conissans TaxID=109636 RepID=A0A9P6CM05_9AGAR|nr:hypothetical protein BDN70DRAFT_998496 [Pholiota conissans]